MLVLRLGWVPEEPWSRRPLSLPQRAMEGRSRIEPFLRAMATLARAVGSDLEDYLVSLGLPPDSEPRTPVSSQEQLEAARAILAIRRGCRW